MMWTKIHLFDGVKIQKKVARNILNLLASYRWTTLGWMKWMMNEMDTLIPGARNRT